MAATAMKTLLERAGSPLDTAEARARSLAAQRGVAVRWSGIKSVSDLSTSLCTSSGMVAASVTLGSDGGRLTMNGSPVVRRVPAGADRYGFRQVRIEAADGRTALVREGDL
jgi:hypothetical protein